MKKTITNIALSIIPGLLFSQELKPMPSTNLRNDKISILTTTGVSVFNSSWAKGSNYYIMPSLTYRVTPRLTISSGIGYTRSQFSSPGEEHSMYTGNLFTVHASAFYKVNDRLSVYGSVYKTQDHAPNAMMNPQAVNFNSQGTSMGFIYKVTDNIHMGFEFRQRNGNPFMSPYGNPYPYSSPFSGPMTGQPR